MGSSHFGEPNLGKDQTSGGTSRKSKKSNSDKPRQPQRGLGVAQLEKIRLHSEMASSPFPVPFQNPYVLNLPQDDMRIQTAYSSSSSFPYSAQPSSSYGFPGNPDFAMGMSHLQRASIDYPNPQLDPTRWPPDNAFIDTQRFPQQRMTRQLFDLRSEDSIERRRWKDERESSSQNSESSGNQEVDLELRLSLKSP